MALQPNFTAMENKSRTGLFFGSFNPVHNGHLEIAGYLLNQKMVDEIWFVLSPQNPLKESRELANAQQRMEMLNLAIAAEPRFRASDVEFNMPVPSYTIDTLQLLSDSHPSREFKLIIGSDNLEEFHLWKDYEKILNTYQVLVYPRASEIKTPFLSYRNVLLTNAPLIKISSTYIRQCILKQKDVSHLLPEKVLNYIRENNLYGA